MAKDAALNFTPAQRAVLGKMIHSIATQPLGFSGRGDWRDTKQIMQRAETELTILGVYRWTARRACMQYASRAPKVTATTTRNTV